MTETTSYYRKIGLQQRMEPVGRLFPNSAFLCFLVESSVEGIPDIIKISLPSTVSGVAI